MPPKSKQLEIFAKEKPPKRVRQEILGNDDLLEYVEKTREPHTCARCENEISVGSKAIRYIPRENGKKVVDKIQYFHPKSACPAIVNNN